MSRDLTGLSVTPLAELLSEADLPVAGSLVGDSLSGFLGQIYYTEAALAFERDAVVVDAHLAFAAAFRFGFLGFDFIQVAIGSLGAGWSGARVVVRIGPDSVFSLREVEIALEFAPWLLRDAATGGPARLAVQAGLTLSGAGLSLDGLENGIDLAPAFVGDTKVRIAARDVQVHLDGDDPEVGFAEAELTLPPDLPALPDITIRNCVINASGFSGAASATWTDDERVDFLGFELYPQSLGLTLVDNAITAFGLAADIVLPLLEAETPSGNVPARIGVHATIGNGAYGFTATNLPELNLFVFKLNLDRLGISFDESGITGTDIGGLLTIPGVDDDEDNPLEIGVGFTILNGIYSITAGAPSESFTIAGVALTFERLKIVFNSSGLLAEQTEIYGELEVPAFQTNGAAVPLKFNFGLLPDGFTIDVDAQGNPALVADLAEQLRVFVSRFHLAKKGNGWDFGLGGVLEPHLTVPALSEVIPSRIAINDFVFADGEPYFDLALSWPGGIEVAGNSETGIGAYIPISRDIGGVFHLDAIRITLVVNGGVTELEFTFDGLRLTLGPFVGVADGMGLQAAFEARDGGNLGPLDVTLTFVPPKGIGLSLDAGVIRGGGYLRLEDPRYEGALELALGDWLQIGAIALITTELPDGKPGVSVLVIVSAQFSPGIALGMGFFLGGLGGIVGIHRTIQTDALRDGVKNNSIDHILFPENVVANISSIIENLRAIFPVQRDQFVFGVMAKITWGVPPLLSVELGLVLELSNPARLAILGVLKAILPDEKASVLQLQVNFLGVIDFEQKELSFDASLFGSRLLAFTLEGDMALRLSWGSRPSFLLSMGGFHPAYEPPAHFKLSEMKRLSLSLLRDNPKISLKTYFAVTSNTVQFGAALDLVFRVSDFSIVGDLGFDVLFQFSPFKFDARVHAGVAVKMGGSTLLSITAHIRLQGPTPWIANGTGTFKVLFFDVDIQFSKTWGETRSISEPTVAVLPEVTRALGADSAWQASSTGGHAALVTMTQHDSGAAAPIIDPLGVLEVRQTVLPLGIAVTRFGNAKIADIKRVRVAGLKIGSRTITPDETRDAFAPAAFRQMIDSDKLRAASYVDEISGARMPPRLEAPLGVLRPVQYEVRITDEDLAEGGAPVGRGAGVTQDTLATFRQLVRGGAARHSPVARRLRVRARIASGTRFAVAADGFTVIDTDTLRPAAGVSTQAGTQAQAEDDLQRLREADPAHAKRLRVVPTSEIVNL